MIRDYLVFNPAMYKSMAERRSKKLTLQMRYLQIFNLFEMLHNDLHEMHMFNKMIGEFFSYKLL